MKRSEKDVMPINTLSAAHFLNDQNFDPHIDKLRNFDPYNY